MGRERTEMRRPAVKMAAAMMPAAEMASSTTEMMSSTATMATLRDRKVRHGQHRCEDNRGNSQCDF